MKWNIHLCACLGGSPWYTIFPYSEGCSTPWGEMGVKAIRQRKIATVFLTSKIRHWEEKGIDSGYKNKEKNSGITMTTWDMLTFSLFHEPQNTEHLWALDLGMLCTSPSTSSQQHPKSSLLLTRPEVLLSGSVRASPTGLLFPEPSVLSLLKHSASYNSQLAHLDHLDCHHAKEGTGSPSLHSCIVVPGTQ